jgi:Periplasmic copper-binding protein (NosD)
MKKKAWFIYASLAGILGCGRPLAPQAPVTAMVIGPGNDIADVVARNPRCHEFLLETGEYTCGKGMCIYRNQVVIRRKSPTDEPGITETMQICGQGNTLDGLTWDADKADLRRSDPGTLAISGTKNIVRNCVFRNFRTSANGYKIIMIGRLLTNGEFTNTVADSNTIESCTFDNWGLRDEPHGSVKSSACIAVGWEQDKGKFTGTVIRKNLFVNGPYKQYGYNAAVKVFNSILLEDNIFYGGQECMEMKYGNSTIRGNIIHRFSGYNVLANRFGRNSLYENNTVYDVSPADPVSSAQGFMIWECGNTVFRNNLIYDCQTTGRIIGRETATPHNSVMEYLLIGNNSFINNKREIVFDNKNGSPKHLVITKNIFYDSTGASGPALLNVDTASLEYYADNLYYGVIQGAGDLAPVRMNPQFIDTAAQDFRPADHSPACGYGALPCRAPQDRNQDSTYDPGHYVVLYPTKDRWVFHIALVGLDIQPQRLEVDDPSGKVLVSRAAPEPGYKLFANIDLRASHGSDYIIKLITNKAVITKEVHLDY